MREVPTFFPTYIFSFVLSCENKSRKMLRNKDLLEAAVGIEPTNKGFADLCLTTWLRRHFDLGIRIED